MKYPTCTDASVDISASTVTDEIYVDSSSTIYIFLSLKKFCKVMGCIFLNCGQVAVITRLEFCKSGLLEGLCVEIID